MLLMFNFILFFAIILMEGALVFLHGSLSGGGLFRFKDPINDRFANPSSLIEFEVIIYGRIL